MLILIADSHLAGQTAGLEEFRKLLLWISSTPHDVCFLGDIMELWIALPGFEKPLHQEFLAWCRAESNRRKIYLVEGNHEFFVAARHADCFTGSSEDVLKAGKDVFCHGDLIQRHPLTHRPFRRLSKSRIAFFLLQFLPGVQHIVGLLQRFLQNRSKRFSPHLPLPEIRHWLEHLQPQPGDRVFLGHFHLAGQEKLSGGAALFCLPAWKEKQEIGVFDPAKERCSFLHWRDLADPSAQPQKDSTI